MFHCVLKTPLRKLLLKCERKNVSSQKLKYYNRIEECHKMMLIHQSVFRKTTFLILIDQDYDGKCI